MTLPPLDVVAVAGARAWTVYRQLSAQPPHRLLPLKKNLNHFCLDCHSVCDNIYCSLTMFSALAAVCTVDCAIEIVLITITITTATVIAPFIRIISMSQYQNRTNILTTLSAQCFVQDTLGGLEQEMIRHYHHCPPQCPRSVFSIYCKPKHLTFSHRIIHIILIYILSRCFKSILTHSLASGLWKSTGINGEGRSQGQPADPGSPGKMVSKTDVCVLHTPCACRCNFM